MRNRLLLIAFFSAILVPSLAWPHPQTGLFVALWALEIVAVIVWG